MLAEWTSEILSLSHQGSQEKEKLHYVHSARKEGRKVYNTPGSQLG